MEEIKEVLKKYDIAGAIALHTPGFGEHYLRIDPSYSGASLLPQAIGIGLHLEIKSSEIGAKKAKQMAEDTSNMFHILNEMQGRNVIVTMEAEKIINQKLNPEHNGEGYSSGQSQNN